jgi:hypothetical protein
VARLSGLNAGNLVLLKRGKLRSHRGWISLEPIEYKGKLGRAYVWEHDRHGVFVGGSRELEISFPQYSFNRSSLAKVRRGALNHTCGWRFKGQPSIEQEIASRLTWATSDFSDSDLRKGITTRDPNVVK